MPIIIKKRKRLDLKSTVVWSVALFVCATFYFAGIYATRQITTRNNQIRSEQISNEIVANAITRQIQYDSKYFVTAASNLLYVSHDPSLVERAYELAIAKAPVNFETLFSFGMYAASRQQLDRAEKLFSEAARRFPTNARLRSSAGVTLWRAGRPESAMKFLNEALSLDASLSPEIYRLVSTSPRSVELLVRITPKDPEPMVRLCQYLAGRQDISSSHLLELIRETLSLPLDANQRLKMASVASNAGFFSLASEEAVQLRKDSAFTEKADRLLIEIQKRQRKQRTDKK